MSTPRNRSRALQLSMYISLAVLSPTDLTNASKPTFQISQIHDHQYTFCFSVAAVKLQVKV